MKIKLNNFKYRYDVYQIISLFVDYNDVEFVKEHADICIIIEDSQISIKTPQNIINHKLKYNNFHFIKQELKNFLFLYFKQTIKRNLPWGTIIGIRPTKIAMNLLKSGKSDSEIIDYYNEHYLTSSEKAKLCIDIAKFEKNYVNTDEKNISIYIDMPFCPSRCLYCSFTSNAISKCGTLVEDYLRALSREILKLSEYIQSRNLNVECVYFGGGTPTSIDDVQFEKILKCIYENFVSNSSKEFTVECGRPDTINLAKLKAMKKYGVTRISINPQTMNDETLKIIGRKHNTYDIIRKFNMARDAGFDNINMDIIIGLPGENIKHIENTCNKIKELNPENITVHGLCIKRGSRLHESIINNHEFKIADEDEIYKMYQLTYDLAKDLSMRPYYLYKQKNMVGNLENIGFSKKSKECIYNMQMIEERETIIALGADAVSKVIFMNENRIERFPNVKDVREYIDRIDEMIDKKIQLLQSLYG